MSDYIDPSDTASDSADFFDVPSDQQPDVVPTWAQIPSQVVYNSNDDYNIAPDSETYDAPAGFNYTADLLDLEIDQSLAHRNNFELDDFIVHQAENTNNQEVQSGDSQIGCGDEGDEGNEDDEDEDQDNDSNDNDEDEVEEVHQDDQHNGADNDADDDQGDDQGDDEDEPRWYTRANETQASVRPLQLLNEPTFGMNAEYPNVNLQPNSQPVGHQPMNYQPVYYAPALPIPHQPAYHNPFVHQPINHHPACYQPICYQPIYHQSAYLPPAYPQPIYHQEGYPQPAYYQPAYRQFQPAQPEYPPPTYRQFPFPPTVVHEPAHQQPTEIQQPAPQQAAPYEGFHVMIDEAPPEIIPGYWYLLMMPERWAILTALRTDMEGVLEGRVLQDHVRGFTPDFIAEIEEHRSQRG